MEFLSMLSDFCKRIKEKLFYKMVTRKYLLSSGNEDDSLDDDKETEVTMSEEVKNKELSIASKNTLIDEINLMRTKLSRIELVCPAKYVEFNSILDELEKECTEEYRKYYESFKNDSLVFTCNPASNRTLTDKIRKTRDIIDEYISSEVTYKLLEDRLSKLYRELLKYYNQYVIGSYKGDFSNCIYQATSTISEVIKRVLEDEAKASDESTFYKKKGVSEIYSSLGYIIQKCMIRYSLKNNIPYDLKKDFKAEFLVPLMRDINTLKKRIDTFKSTKYYGQLLAKYNKIRSINISNLDSLLKSEDFFNLLLSIEDSLISFKRKIKIDNVSNKSDKLLQILNTNKGGTKNEKNS